MAQAQVSTQHASSKHIGKVAVIDLLDDYWFFHSTLFTTKQPPPNYSVDASSSSSPSLEIKATKQRDSSATASSFSNQKMINLSTSSSTPDQLELPSSQQHKSALLTRMPTLPVPRLREDPTAMPPFNSCYTKLRHSMSALDTYQSTTTTTSSSSPKNTCTNLSSGAGDRPPRHMIKLEKTADRYSTIRDFIAREAYYRKTFKEKKWRSLGDLEYIEIQGLKDLGFVLEKELQGRQMNARSFSTASSTTVPVILNSLQTAACAQADDSKVVMRPYLSQRSAPPMFRWVNRKSADDMKDQLRFWAKAVASNTRQA